MTLRLLVAVDHEWEGRLVEVLGDVRELEIVRRCADLADLLAAGAAGLGDVAVVSAGVRGLDRAALDHLEGHGVRIAGLTQPGDESAERRLRQLGVRVVLPLDAPVRDLTEALVRIEPLGSAPGVDQGTASLDDAVLDSLRSSSSPLGPGRPGENADVGVPGTTEGPGSDSIGVLVAVWGPTGAPGRSTIALNLAAEVAAAGSSALVVDLDTYGSSLAQSLALLDEAPGLATAARAAEQGTLDLPALARMAPVVSPGLRILSGLPRAERWPEVRSGALEQVLALTRRLAEVVVVDCGFGVEDDEVLSYDTRAPRRNATTLTALAHADRLLVVGTADPVGLQRLVRAVQDVGPLQSPRPEVVVNRVRASAVGTRPQRRISEALGRFAGMEALHFVPLDIEALDAALLAGQTLREAAPGSPARTAVVALARSFVPAGRADLTRRGRRMAHG